MTRIGFHFALLTALAAGAPVYGKIENIRLLSSEGNAPFTQDARGLNVTLPVTAPCKYASP